VTRKEYVLITPAKNEEAYIEKTIEAVLSQTVLPQKWVIVSDGSVDFTDEIVARYEQRHSFICLVRAGKQGQKDFGSKVKAFQAGYSQVRDAHYDFLGNLDADVTFGADYYEQILERFHANPGLGLG
jgi:biofilm PGA synthesis N-glycosyltransferase PgaC